MADESSSQESEGAEDVKKKGPGIILWLLVAVVAVGGGFALPFFLKPQSSDPNEEIVPVVNPDEPPVFVDFGEVVVNLNEPRLNRYLRMNISLQVHKEFQSDVATAVEKNKTNLISWLLSYLSGKQMEDIRGTEGQNRLRREIKNHFNASLFPTGHEHVKSILFTEFNIQ